MRDKSGARELVASGENGQGKNLLHQQKGDLVPRTAEQIS